MRKTITYISLVIFLTSCASPATQIPLPAATPSSTQTQTPIPAATTTSLPSLEEIWSISEEDLAQVSDGLRFNPKTGDIEMDGKIIASHDEKGDVIVQTPDGFLALENGKRPQRLDANGIGFGMLTIPDAESPYGVRILNRASGEFVLPVDLREFHLKINVDMFLDLVHSGVVSDSILLDVQRSGTLQQAKGINLYFGFGIGTLEGDGVKLVFNRDYTIWDKENGFWVVAGSEEDGFVMNNNVTLVDPNTHDIISETTLNAILLTDGSILTITNVWGDRMLEDDSAGRRRFNFQVIDKRDSVDSRVSILLQVDNGDCATARPNNSDSSRPFTACKLAGGSISLDRGWEIVPNLVPTSVFTNLSVNNQFILVDFGDLKLRQAFAELQKHVLVSLR